MSPAAVLVQLALKRWSECRVRADNISVVVVLFENCKSLRDYSYKDEMHAVCNHSVSCVSDTSARNPVRICAVKKCKTHRGKKSCSRKPLTVISDSRNNKCSIVKHRKNEFKIPTTPEQRSAYWVRRKSLKASENLPSDFNLLANDIHMQSRCDRQIVV